MLRTAVLALPRVPFFAFDFLVFFLESPPGPADFLPVLVEEEPELRAAALPADFFAPLIDAALLPEPAEPFAVFLVAARFR